MAIRSTPALGRGNSSVVTTPAVAEHEAQIQERTRQAIQAQKKPTHHRDTPTQKPTPPQSQESNS